MSGGMGITRENFSNSSPVWQGTNKDIQLLQGGCLLNVTGLTIGAEIKAGSPLTYDEGTRLATILHTATSTLTSTGTATTYQVAKGHTIAVGDNLASGAIGGKAYPVTVIDKTNADYDVLTVGTSIGVVTLGDTLYASTATGATASALPAINARLYDDAIVKNGISVSPVIRGTVYARRVPNSTAIETALKTNGAYIIHSKSL